jgi:outer membrane biosynthesis protein TonB
VSFDIQAESPKLTFKPIGFLDDAGFAEVQAMVGSDLVTNILGANPAPVEAAAPAEEAPAKAVAKPKPAPAAEEEAEEAPAPKAEAKPKAAAKPKSAPVMEDEVDFDLDGINFDD